MRDSKVPPIRLGIIGSSGGGALAAASNCLKAAGKHVEWIVVTDRECGLEVWSKKNGHAVYRLNYKNAHHFSKSAFEIFQSKECENVLLFYTRRIATPLAGNGTTWNIHPALLPSFRGLNGIDDALAAGVKIFGATLHQVDDDLDTGPIVAQVASGLSNNLSKVEVKRISYRQKVWLTLTWFDLLFGAGCRNEESHIFFNSAVGIATPGLVDQALLDSYENWLASKESIGIAK